MQRRRAANNGNNTSGIHVKRGTAESVDPSILSRVPCKVDSATGNKPLLFNQGQDSASAMIATSSPGSVMANGKASKEAAASIPPATATNTMAAAAAAAVAAVDQSNHKNRIRMVTVTGTGITPSALSPTASMHMKSDKASVKASAPVSKCVSSNWYFDKPPKHFDTPPTPPHTVVDVVRVLSEAAEKLQDLDPTTAAKDVPNGNPAAATATRQDSSGAPDPSRRILYSSEQSSDSCTCNSIRNISNAAIQCSDQ